MLPLQYNAMEVDGTVEYQLNILMCSLYRCRRSRQDIGGLLAGGVPAAARARVPHPRPVAAAPALLPARHHRRPSTAAEAVLSRL